MEFSGRLLRIHSHCHSRLGFYYDFMVLPVKYRRFERRLPDFPPGLCGFTHEIPAVLPADAGVFAGIDIYETWAKTWATARLFARISGYNVKTWYMGGRRTFPCILTYRSGSVQGFVSNLYC